MRKFFVITAALVTMILLAACGTSAVGDPALGAVSDQDVEQPALGSISDLQDVEHLRSMFGQDDGEIRLVLLLSPT